MTAEKQASFDLPQEYTRAATILLRGYLRLYVLEKLQERALAGSEIADDLMHSCSWRPSPGTVYPLLQRLEQEGLARSHWETANGRPRRVYALTEEGSRERVRLRQRLEPELRRTLRMLQLHIDYLFGSESG